MNKACSVVLVVGVGRLGARYLQGLAKVKSISTIYAVEPSPEARESAMRLLSLDRRDHDLDIRFAESLEVVPPSVDLVIVSTVASCRAQVVAAVASRHDVKYWILEKVLAQNSGQVRQIENFVSGSSGAWVNTPRRLMDWQRMIKNYFVVNSLDILSVQVKGGQWGLACNAIHFIDLVCWWTGAAVEAVDPSGLESWIPSKRHGFHEVHGALSVYYSNGTRLDLACNQDSQPIQLVVETSHGIWLIDESGGRAVSPTGAELVGNLSLQSVLTAPLARGIIQSGSCDLPALTDSAAQHRPFLDALLQHWNQSQSREDVAVPIT